MRTTDGMTLVDILMALAVFAIAFLVLLGLYPIGKRSMEQAQALSGGSFLAEQILEAERAQDFGLIVSKGPLDVEPERVQTLVRHGNVVKIDYRYQVLVTPFQDGLNPPAKNLVVIVTWTVGEILRSVQLETDVVDL